jgi:hypothetical protein
MALPKETTLLTIKRKMATKIRKLNQKFVYLNYFRLGKFYFRFKMAAILKFARIGTVSVTSNLFRDGSISNIVQHVKNYICAKFDACNQK